MSIPQLRAFCGVNAHWNTPTAVPGVSDNFAEGTNGQTISLSYPSVSGKRYYLGGISWSVNDAPSAGANVMLASTPGGTLAKYYIRVAGPDQVLFHPPVSFPIGASVTVTLDPVNRAPTLHAQMWIYESDPAQWV